MNLDWLDPIHGVGYFHWLAGFIDGEGCFTVYCGKSNWKCRFALSVRADELPTLLEIQERTGIGTILTRPGRKNSAPQSTWQVQSRTDCLTLVEILDRFPLRAKKAADYALWREAVQAWDQVKRTNVKGANDPAWNTMQELGARISAGRRFDDRLSQVV